MIRSLVSLIFLTFVGCSSAPFPEGLSEARVGMDKSQILSLGGNPARTYREKSQDHWIYEYSKDDQRIVRHLVFQDGMLLSIGPAFPKKIKTDTNEPEDAEDMDQFEKKMKEKAAQKPKGEFKDID